jgi:hypothetical protein
MLNGQQREPVIAPRLAYRLSYREPPVSVADNWGADCVLGV